MNHNKNFFLTQSLALASAIQTVSKAKLEHIEFPDSSRRASFIFDKSKDDSFDEIVSKFWANQLPFDLSTYFDQLRLMKARLYEEQNARS
jgi:hypothetical protein